MNLNNMKENAISSLMNIVDSDLSALNYNFDSEQLIQTQYISSPMFKMYAKVLNDQNKKRFKIMYRRTILTWQSRIREDLGKLNNKEISSIRDKYFTEEKQTYASVNTLCLAIEEKIHTTAIETV